MTSTTISAAATATKTKIFSVLTVFFIYLAPIHILIVLIGSAIIFDTLAGRWCAKKLAQRDNKDVRLEVTSKKTRTGLVSKMITYQTSIILLFVLDKYILNDVVNWIFESFPIEFVTTKLIGLIFLLIEFDSFDEKYYLVKGKRLKTIFTTKIKSIKRLIFSAKKFNNESKN